MSRDSCQLCRETRHCQPDQVRSGFRSPAHPLTVKSLAEEAQVKRWVLTHRHTDLQDEFRARIADTTGNHPPALRKLHDAHADATEKIQELRAELAGLKATQRQY